MRSVIINPATMNPPAPPESYRWVFLKIITSEPGLHGIGSANNHYETKAVIAALEQRPREVDEMVREFRRRRDRIVAGLNDIEGVTCVMPRGAFYAFPNVKRLGRRSAVLNDALLNEAGVACLAGTAFGTMGEGYLRLSYANSLDNIEEALRRFSRWVREQSAVRA